MLDYIIIFSKLFVILSTFVTAVWVLCAEKKSQLPSAFTEGYSNVAKQLDSGEKRPKPLVIRPPEEMKQVGTFDPKYQTLAGLNNADVFENKAGGGPVGGAVGGGAPGAGVAIKPPAPGMVKMAATFDPNYQTLAGMNNDDVFKNKNFAGGMGFGGFGGGGPPKPAPKMAGTFDPNYQTLAGMNNEDVFKPKGNGAAKPPAAAPPKPGGPKVVGAFDPNYQTLAGLNNEDVFKPKADCAPAGGGAPKWETY